MFLKKDITIHDCMEMWEDGFEIIIDNGQTTIKNAPSAATE